MTLGIIQLLIKAAPDSVRSVNNMFGNMPLNLVSCIRCSVPDNIHGSLLVIMWYGVGTDCWYSAAAGSNALHVLAVLKCGGCGGANCGRGVPAAKGAGMAGVRMIRPMLMHHLRILIHLIWSSEEMCWICWMWRRPLKLW